MTDLKLFHYGRKEVRTVNIDDEVWFVAKDVTDILDLGSASLAVNGRADRPGSGLDDDEKGVANVSTPFGEQEMLIINEAGLYTLIIRSNKPEAKRFKRWITHDVLPRIRKTGQYVPPDHGILPLVSHTDIAVQKAMSNYVNSHNFRKRGKRGAILYNIKNCQIHNDGRTPKQMRALGKAKGLKSIDRQSGKAVARKLFPEKACCQSLADNLVEQGYEPQKVFAITPQAASVFQGILALGAVPPELNQVESK